MMVINIETYFKIKIDSEQFVLEDGWKNRDQTLLFLLRSNYVYFLATATLPSLFEKWVITVNYDFITWTCVSVINNT